MPQLIQTATIIGLLSLLPILANGQSCQTASVSVTTPDNRFINHNDGTVTDSKTGLMWKRCSEGQTFNAGACSGVANLYRWQAALQQVQTANVQGFAGFNNWRLPNSKELRSIVERQCFDPAINLNIFPSTVATVFWSSSRYAGNSNTAWGVDFTNGNDNGYLKSDTYQVRLVRIGQ